MPLSTITTALIEPDAQLGRGHMNADAAIPTGVMWPYIGATAPAGWVLAFGTIGSAASGATNRANADCQALYSLIWNSFSDTEAPVTGGRGASAANDFANNKPIALPNARGRTLVMKDDMGGTAADVAQVTLSGTTSAGSATITGLSSTANLAVGMKAAGANIPAGRTIASIDSATQVTLNSGTGVTAGTASIRFGIINGTVLGDTGGAQSHVLSEAQIPSHTHTGSTASAGAHTHSVPLTASTGGSGASAASVSGTGPTTSTDSQGAHTHTLTINATGSGRAHPNMPPSLVVNCIIKL